MEKLIRCYLSKETATVFIVFDSDIKLKDFELKKRIIHLESRTRYSSQSYVFFCVINQSLNWLVHIWTELRRFKLEYEGSAVFGK